jgi:hypothetical protein
MDFSIHEESWNQSSTDSEQQLCVKHLAQKL